ncbi:MAG: VOC family protein [Patescibacteria group bacterium]
MADTKTEEKLSPDNYWQQLRSKAPLFVESAIGFANEIGLNVSDLKIDHIGLRYSKPEDVDFLKKALDLSGTNISTAVVNGRPISIYKLIKPIEAGNYQIPCVELPFPAKEHNYPEDGWEHVEFVLPNPNMGLEENFKARYPNFKGDYKIDEPKVEGEQLPNPTIILKHPTNKMLTLKFHGNSIEEVVRSKS